MSHFLPVKGFPRRYLFSPSCVPSPFFGTSPLDKCVVMGRVVVKIAIIFKMESDHAEAFSSSHVCVLRWDGLRWAVWSGLVTEGQMLSGGGERVHEKREEWRNLSFFFFFSPFFTHWHLSKMKASPSLLLFWGEGNHVSAARHWTLCSVVDSL